MIEFKRVRFYLLVLLYFLYLRLGAAAATAAAICGATVLSNGSGNTLSTDKSVVAAAKAFAAAIFISSVIEVAQASKAQPHERFLETQGHY